MAKITKETDLYPPIRDFLTAQGYTVRSEVNHCDITAVRGDELSIDAGTLVGAPVVDESGEVIAVLRGPGQALAAGAIVAALAPPAPSDGRVRNLGISLAFFLGLMGWWRYRLKGRRY